MMHHANTFTGKALCPFPAAQAERFCNTLTGTLDVATVKYPG